MAAGEDGFVNFVRAVAGIHEDEVGREGIVDGPDGLRVTGGIDVEEVHAGGGEAEPRPDDVVALNVDEEDGLGADAFAEGVGAGDEGGELQELLTVGGVMAAAIRASAPVVIVGLLTGGGVVGLEEGCGILRKGGAGPEGV